MEVDEYADTSYTYKQQHEFETPVLERVIEPMVVMDGEEYLTAEEARGLLGVKAATLYAYVSRGLLSSYRQGIKRQRLYKKSQVESLLGLKPGGKFEKSSRQSPRIAESDANDSLIPSAESWIPYV